MHKLETAEANHTVSPEKVSEKPLFNHESDSHQLAQIQVLNQKAQHAETPPGVLPSLNIDGMGPSGGICGGHRPEETHAGPRDKAGQHKLDQDSPYNKHNPQQHQTDTTIYD